MSQITTHILDTSAGKPAAGVEIVLLQQTEQGQQWSELARGVTNADGRVADLLQKEVLLAPGIYKLTFYTKPYFDASKIESFYPYIQLVFNVNATQHYHVPLLLNPFGYTTYRGS